MNYGIAILPDQSIQQLANSFRKRYDPHYKLILPHITIRESFHVSSESELSPIISELEAAAQTTPSFNLIIAKISTFYPVNNVIYLAIEESENLRDLHKRIGEPADKRPYAFIPHITIAQKMDTDEMLDIYSGIKMNDVKHEFTVDQFHLFQQGEDKVWSIFRTFDLKSI